MLAIKYFYAELLERLNRTHFTDCIMRKERKILKDVICLVFFLAHSFILCCVCLFQSTAGERHSEENEAGHR